METSETLPNSPKCFYILNRFTVVSMLIYTDTGGGAVLMTSIHEISTRVNNSGLPEGLQKSPIAPEEFIMLNR